MGRKTALITGASSGIGAAFAYRLAEKGYDLILTGRREELLNKKAALIKKDWAVNIDIILVEFSDDNQVESFLNIFSHRDINVLTNNAGFGISRYYHQENFCEWDKMVDVHIRCLMKIVYNILPQMIRYNEGVIINVSSISSFLPIPKNSIYSGTKSFIRVFSETLNLEV